MKLQHDPQAWKTCLKLAEQLVIILQKKQLHITCVESCTGGGLAHALTCIPGASRVFESGFITYSEASKIQFGVSSEIIQKHAVYSTEVAIAMAQSGLKNSIHADLSVAITGLLTTFDPHHVEIKPGIVYLAIATQNQVFTKVIHLAETGSRVKDKELIINFILQEILEFLVVSVF